MKDYRKKIEKLLALSSSPNEHEAKAALLKARQLMAEHKLSEKDFKRNAGREVVEIEIEEITFTAQRDPWIEYLANAIAEAYCCVSFRRHGYRNRTNTIGVTGLKEDAEICASVLKYAISCVREKIKEIRKENAVYNYKYIRRLCDSYGYGFSSGIFTEFKKQKEEHQEWGLVLAKPPEVQEAVSGYKKSNLGGTSTENLVQDNFLEGRKDGIEFQGRRRIEGTAWDLSNA